MKYKVLVKCVVEFDLEIEANSNEEAESIAKSIEENQADEYLDTTVVHEDFTNDYKSEWIEFVAVHEQSLIENSSATV